MRAAVVIVSLSIARVASAGAPDAFGFGSRSTALGGAVSADANDASATYYNPAALASIRGLRFEAGYVRADPQLRMNGQDNFVDPVRGTNFGIVAPGEIATVPFAFGVGLHLPDDRVFRVRSLEQSQPRWELYDNRPQRIWLSTAIAVRPLPFLEVGGGLVFLAATRARLDITGDLNLASPVESELRHEVDADLSSIRYPQAGLRILASDRLRFAAVYRGEFRLGLDIAARLDVAARPFGTGTLSIPFLAFITTSSVNAFLPRQVVLGGSWDPIDDLTLDADVTWVNWGAYVSPVTAVDVVTRYDAPEGFPSGLLPERPAPTIVLPPRFENRIVPRLGVEGRRPIGRHTFALRGGYAYERSPIPEQTAGTNFVDADRHVVTTGVGVTLRDLGEALPGALRIDLHGMLSLLPTRITAKASPADPIGDYRAGGTIVSFGVTTGFEFR
jgi:long-chain fatty acid transport protein